MPKPKIAVFERARPRAAHKGLEDRFEIVTSQVRFGMDLMMCRLDDFFTGKVDVDGIWMSNPSPFDDVYNRQGFLPEINDYTMEIIARLAKSERVKKLKADVKKILGVSHFTFKLETTSDPYQIDRDRIRYLSDRGFYLGDELFYLTREIFSEKRIPVCIAQCYGLKKEWPYEVENLANAISNNVGNRVVLAYANYLVQKAKYSRRIDKLYVSLEDISMLLKAGAKPLFLNKPAGSDYTHEVMYRGHTFQSSSKEEYKFSKGEMQK